MQRRLQTQLDNFPICGRWLRVLLLLAVVVPVSAEEPSYSLSLKSRQDCYFLGENVLVDFEVRNTGREILELEFGGDYRGAPRSTRFQLEIFDQNGQLLKDPYPDPLCLGGLSHRPRLAPGQSYFATLQLYRYRRLEQAGCYRVRATHDLGISNSKWAELGANLSLKEPSPGEAREVVARALQLPRLEGTTAGQITPNHQDFSCLGYPVYLEPLEALKSPLAVLGLGQIAGSAATESLLRLAELPEIQKECVEQLLGRLPETDLATWNLAQSQYLAAGSWIPHNRILARKLGLRLLSSSEPTQAVLGAKLLYSFGEAPDLPGLLERANYVLPSVRGYPRPASLAHDLERTLQRMLLKGEIVSKPVVLGSTPAEKLLRLLEKSDFPISDGELEACLECASARVRELAVTRLSSQSKSLGRLPDLLVDPDPGVQVAACQRVGAHPKVLQLLRTSHDEWVLRAAANASISQRVAAAEIVVERLGEPERFNEFYGILLGLMLEQLRGYGSSGLPRSEEIAQLQGRWRSYLRDHRQELNAKGINKLPASLIPSTYQLHP